MNTRSPLQKCASYRDSHRDAETSTQKGCEFCLGVLAHMLAKAFSNSGLKCLLSVLWLVKGGGL